MKFNRSLGWDTQQQAAASPQVLRALQLRRCVASSRSEDARASSAVRALKVAYLIKLRLVVLCALLGMIAPRAIAAQISDYQPDALSAEIQQAISLSTKLRAVARSVDNEVWIGTMYNEIDAKEHSCYSLGVLIGQADAVRHLRLGRNPTLRATNSDEAHSLRVTAQSLDNFVDAAKHAGGLAPEERALEWNLDCVGQLGVKGKPVKLVGANTFYRLKKSGQVLQVLGDIEPGFTAKIRAAIESNPRVIAVALGSGGGSVYEALAAGQYLRSKRLETTLWNNCFSACPLVFIGGVERTVWSPYPYLGFHKIYTSSGPIPLNSPVYREVADYIRRMGVSDRFFLEKMLSAEPSQMLGIRGTTDLCNYKIATWVQRVC